MGLFRKDEDELDGRLREARPEPPADLVSELARSLRSAPVRRSPRLRLGIAAGLTSALLVAFASVGGAGYAAAAVSKAATAVSAAGGSDSKKSDAPDSKAAATSSHKAAASNSRQNYDPNHPSNHQYGHDHMTIDPHHPSNHQYGQDHMTICHNGHTLVLQVAHAQAHLTRHPRDTAGPCPR